MVHYIIIRLQGTTVHEQMKPEEVVGAWKREKNNPSNKERVVMADLHIICCHGQAPKH